MWIRSRQSSAFSGEDCACAARSCLGRAGQHLSAVTHRARERCDRRKGIRRYRKTDQKSLNAANAAAEMAPAIAESCAAFSSTSSCIHSKKTLNFNISANNKLLVVVNRAREPVWMRHHVRQRVSI